MGILFYSLVTNEGNTNQYERKQAIQKLIHTIENSRIHNR